MCLIKVLKPDCSEKFYSPVTRFESVTPQIEPSFHLLKSGVVYGMTVPVL